MYQTDEQLTGEKVIIKFTRDKVTKNTVRFTSPQGNEISGSLYVAKDSEAAKQDELVLEIISEKTQVTA